MKLPDDLCYSVSVIREAEELTAFGHRDFKNRIGTKQEEGGDHDRTAER